jgi:signal transduction histidine kinase
MTLPGPAMGTTSKGYHLPRFGWLRARPSGVLENVFNSEYSRQNRRERLIAAGRLAVASCALVGVLIGTNTVTNPVRLFSFTEMLLAIYLAYGFYAAVRAWRNDDVPSFRVQVATHVADLLLPAVVLAFTGGPASPFFPLFAFPLLSATLRWYRRGTLWTGVFSIAAFCLIAAQAGLAAGALQVHDFVLGGAHLIVVTAFLSYVGACEHQAQREIAALAAWMREGVGHGEALFADALRQAAFVLEAPRILVVWIDPDHSWVSLALWANAKLTLTQEPPGALEWLVAEPLTDSDFICDDAAATDARVRCVSPTPFHWRGAALHDKLQSSFDIRRMVSVQLRGGLFDGRLFVLDRPSATPEDITLAAIVARQMENRLEHNYLTRVRNAAAVAEERARVARDVHDGVLQSLTSFALQLETVRRQLETKPLVAATGIHALQNMILLEQQSLRSFVRKLQGDEVESDSGLSDLLTELARRLERQWNLMIKLNILLEPDRLNTVIPPRLAREIYQLVREALVNVARHAQASQAWVSLDATDEEARLIVADDGVGFPSIGYMEHADLLRHGRGPKMLMARVGALGGSFSIASSPGGARLLIKLPLRR